MSLSAELRRIHDRLLADGIRLIAIAAELRSNHPLAAPDIWQAGAYAKSAAARLDDALMLPLEPVVENEPPSGAALQLEDAL